VPRGAGRISLPPDSACILAVDHSAILGGRDDHAGAALGIYQLDGLGYGVRIFAAVLHGFEAQAGPVYERLYDRPEHKGVQNVMHAQHRQGGQHGHNCDENKYFGACIVFKHCEKFY
jgi:hypothetical protein